MQYTRKHVQVAAAIIIDDGRIFATQRAHIKSGNLVLKEHQAAKWLTRETLDSVEWLPADIGLIEKLKKNI